MTIASISNSEAGSSVRTKLNSVIDDVNASMWGIAISDETTDLTTGTAKVTLDLPFAFEFTRVYASVTTAPTGAAIQVDVNDEGVTILNSVLSISASANNGEQTSFSGAASSYSMSKGDKLTIDIDQIGSTIAGAGLKVFFIGKKG
jgi:hypothetical protein